MDKSKEDDYQQHKEAVLHKCFEDLYEHTKRSKLLATLGETPLFPDIDHSLERGFEILSKKTRERSISLSSEFNKIPVSKLGLFGMHHVAAVHKETQEDQSDNQQTVNSDKPKRS